MMNPTDEIRALRSLVRIADAQLASSFAPLSAFDDVATDPARKEALDRALADDLIEERPLAGFYGLLVTDAGGESRWRLLHENGQVVAGPQEGYARPEHAQQMFERLFPGVELRGAR